MIRILKTTIVGFLCSGILLSAMCIARADTHGEVAEVARPKEVTSDHTFGANILIGNDYIYRGITQTNGDPTLQGGLTYGHSSGLYAGTWASNLEFNASTTNAASLEMDFFAGYGFDLGGLTYDVGYLYYMYTGQNEDVSVGDYDFWEIYGSVSKEFGVSLSPSVSVGIAWSPDFYGEDDNGIYVNSSVGISLPAGINPYVKVGYQDVSGDKTNSAGYDYWHYAIGASRDVGAFVFDLSYSEANDYCSGNDQSACEAVVFAISSAW
jgi:uncharacterized protein (TIGR02001 family)